MDTNCAIMEPPAIRGYEPGSCAGREHSLKLGAIQRVRQDITQYARQQAAPEMIAAACKYETKFGIHFGALMHFPKEALADLHREGLPDTITIASTTDHSIPALIDVLSEVANTPEERVTEAQRQQYYDTLLEIYQKLPNRPSAAHQDAETLFVGIEREGRILAEAMGCLPAGHSIRPHTKRVPFEGGLIVGVSRIEVPQEVRYRKCVIIDGAIASGATLIAIMENLRPILWPHGSRFEVYSAHATFEGLRAIARFATQNDMSVEVTVGHATTGLSKKFYAVLPHDPHKVAVGDLGDTISPLRNI